MDLFHGREPLNELAWILEFMLSDLRQDWLAARLDDLGHGDIDGICAAARAYPLAGSKKIDPDKALGYFGNNACAASGSGPAACPSAPVPSRQAARRYLLTELAEAAGWLAGHGGGGGPTVRAHD